MQPALSSAAAGFSCLAQAAQGRSAFYLRPMGPAAEVPLAKTADLRPPDLLEPHILRWFTPVPLSPPTGSSARHLQPGSPPGAQVAGPFATFAANMHAPRSPFKSNPIPSTETLVGWCTGCAATTRAGAPCYPSPPSFAWKQQLCSRADQGTVPLPPAGRPLQSRMASPAWPELGIGPGPPLQAISKGSWELRWRSRRTVHAQRAPAGRVDPRIEDESCND